jgi:cyclic pyranopterin phosphate synthase
MKNKFSHIDAVGNPQMVDVSKKKMTVRIARAQAVVWLGSEIISKLNGDELITKKGPVFQTAIIAGVMGGKKTADLIPFVTPLFWKIAKSISKLKRTRPLSDQR